MSLTLTDLHFSATSPDAQIAVDTPDVHIKNCTFTPWSPGTAAELEFAR
jgi:hypothetical protein